MGLSPFATGTLLILTTGLFFGSQTAFAKCPSVISSDVRMEILNIYFIIGVAMINFLVYFACLIYGSEITFTYLGVLSALFLYFGELFVLLSVKQIGIAYSMAISIFSATVTSCIIELLLGQTIVYWSIVIVGVCITAGACAMIALLKNILRSTNFMNYRVEELILIQNEPVALTSNDSVVNVISELSPLNAEYVNVASEHGNESEIQTPVFSKRRQVSDGKQMLLGGLFTSISGVFFASIPLPSLFTDATNSGVLFSLSFGIGCLVIFPLSLMSVVITNPFYKSKQFDGIQEICEHLFYFKNALWHFRETFWCGLASGLVWGIGNVCGICSFLYLDYVVVNAFIQSHIIWTLMYGIFLFKEIDQKVEIVIIAALCLLLVVGCILVAYGTYGEW